MAENNPRYVWEGWLSMPQVAERLHVVLSTARRKVKQNNWRTRISDSRLLLVSEEDVNNYIAEKYGVKETVSDEQ